MKVKIFWGCAKDVQIKFNEWAKGKGLTKDVIIHTMAISHERLDISASFVIAVYYPEGSQFDKE